MANNLPDLCGAVLFVALLGLVFRYLFVRIFKREPYAWLKRNKDNPEDKNQSIAQTLKTCQKCGEKNQLDAQFCSRCGEKFISVW